MEVAITFIFLFGIPLAFIVGFVLYADKWLRKVDKQKYLEKSLKKQLKKGNITETEYEEGLNPEVITVTEIVLPKREEEMPPEIEKEAEKSELKLQLNKE